MDPPENGADEALLQGAKRLVETVVMAPVHVNHDTLPSRRGQEYEDAVPEKPHPVLSDAEIQVSAGAQQKESQAEGLDQLTQAGQGESPLRAGVASPAQVDHPEWQLALAKPLAGHLECDGLPSQGRGQRADQDCLAGGHGVGRRLSVRAPPLFYLSLA